MKKLSNKDILFIGLMLFSIFFGAGNLIFPPFLGQLAGEKTWIAMVGFLITAVGFPVLGVFAVAKTGGLNELASRINKSFAIVFTMLVYLSIGPFLAIPRAGSLPFEMAVAPYLPESFSTTIALFLFTLVFFIVSYWLSLSPGNLTDRMGKLLTPILLGLIVLMFVGALFKPLGNYGEANGDYVDSPFVKGFLEGYLTMDTLAALIFGIVVSVAIKSKGVLDKKEVVSASIKVGLIAGILLALVYVLLAHLGATSGGRFGDTTNGAQTLTNVVTYIFGTPGAMLLALIFTLACLTTCVGLIAACSQYFTTVYDKISYKNWVRITTLVSMLLANMGLTKILVVSIPVLNAIYPIAIMLIVIALFDDLFKGSKYVYSLTILFTGFVSILDSLGQVGIRLGFVSNLLSKLPLYTEGLAWVIPAIFGLLIGVIVDVITRNPKFNKAF